MSGHHGNSNASHRRKLAQEALRLKIDGEKHIDAIDALLAEPWGDQVAEKRGKMDGHFKLLGKCLPDLRSIEVTDDRSDKPPEEMTDDEIEQRLAENARLRRQLAARAAEAEPSASEPAEVH